MSQAPLATSVAKVNNINILVVDNDGQERVAVKPVCDALGVSHQAQIDRLKTDPILSSVVMLSVTTGADGKQYNMVTIPFRFVFGWLFRIDSRNVKETARESLEKYQRECYDALYDYQYGTRQFTKEREKLLKELTNEVKEAKKQFRIAKEVLYEKQDLTYRVAHATYDDYKNNGMQLTLDLFTGMND